MRHINRATLFGYAGRDPDIRTLTGVDRTASFSLATTEKWKRRDGRPAEATEWHRVVVYGGAVEAIERRVRKGAAVLVEGRITHRKFTDGEGEERRVTEIVVRGPQGLVNVVRRKPDGAVATDTKDGGGAEDTGDDDAG